MLRPPLLARHSQTFTDGAWSARPACALCVQAMMLGQALSLPHLLLVSPVGRWP